MKHKACYFLLLMVLVFLSACSDNAIPKPAGYFRIDMPQRNYIPYQTPCGPGMEIPAYTKIELYSERNTADSCWFNLVFPRFKAKVYCTYLPVNGQLDGLIRDAYGFAAKHEMKASAIDRTRFDNDSTDVHGLMYDIQGETASQLQFFLTDSTNHFLRGALYFDNKPNSDSIAPVLDFIREDIKHVIQTIHWR